MILKIVPRFLVSILYYTIVIYVTLSLIIHVIYWYHFYINQPGDGKIVKTTHEIFFCKYLGIQSDPSVNIYKIY